METKLRTTTVASTATSVSVSVVIPAKNEAQALASLLPKIRELHPEWEIIVVNDGSVDDTAEVCRTQGVTVHSHPYSVGNGGAIKSGARRASGEVIVFMDADGQHRPEEIGGLLAKLEEGFDMVVGARGAESQASFTRWFGNAFYNRFASWVVNKEVLDLTSGFRVARASRFREFLHLLPNGFSYPTTSTMAFFRSGYPIAYVPIQAKERIGKSHIRLVRDGIRFLLIVFRVGTLYAPLKIFLPIAAAIFTTGFAYYGYTYTTAGRFTNMSALLLVSSLLIFLIGLVSEQITMLLYQKGHD